MGRASIAADRASAGSVDGPGGPSRWRRIGAVRDAVRRLPGGRLIWRALVSIAGLVVIVVGIILLPLPGPGWLIIFIGLAIWGTEFEWAHRLLAFARRQVGRWTDWILARPRWLQVVCAGLGLILLAGVAVGAWYLSRLI